MQTPRTVAVTSPKYFWNTLHIRFPPAHSLSSRSLTHTHLRTHTHTFKKSEATKEKQTHEGIKRYQRF